MFHHGLDLRIEVKNMFHHGRDLITEVKGLIAVVNRYGGIIDIEVEIISSRQKKLISSVEMLNHGSELIARHTLSHHGTKLISR